MVQITSIRPQVQFVDAIKIGFNKYATFTGRARRSEYWWWQLFAFLMSLLGIIPVLGWIITVAMIVPNLSISARRLHDIGRTGWWIAAPVGAVVAGLLFVVIGLIFTAITESLSVAGVFGILSIICYVAAGIMQIVIFIWSLFDGKPETNKYGPSPKYVVEE